MLYWFVLLVPVTLHVEGIIKIVCESSTCRCIHRQGGGLGPPAEFQSITLSFARIESSQLQRQAKFFTISLSTQFLQLSVDNFCKNEPHRVKVI